MTHTKHTNGFSLIELSVVMVIIGLLMAGFFSYLNVSLQQKKIDGSVARSEENLAALQSFISKPLTNAAGQNIDRTGAVLPVGAAPLYEHRLPCPATPGLKPGDVDFGIEQCPPGNVTYKGVKVATGTGGEIVFIGAYPVTTIQTYGENAFDGYKSPYIYAVTKKLTSKTTEPVTTGKETGSIIVQSSDLAGAGTTYNDKPFVLISTGANGYSTASSDKDIENMDGDATFLASASISDSKTNYYDDRVAFDFTNTKDNNDNCIIGNMDVQEFTANGTWTKPEKLSYAVIEIWGADGEANSGIIYANSVAVNLDGRGGIGGYAKVIKTAEQLNNVESVNVANNISDRDLGGGHPSGACYVGANAAPTSFSDIVLSGGKGATCGSGNMPIDGLPGTVAPQGTFFTTLTSERTHEPRPAEYAYNGCSHGAETCDETWALVRPADPPSTGIVRATSYICK